MPINNINTLQNYEDLRYTTYLAYQDANGVLNTDYYIHALANLEQRNEYRYSNGIKYGILNYDTDVVITPESVFGNNTAEATMFLELPNDMGFDIYVNNIETYLKHSQIYNDGNVILENISVLSLWNEASGANSVFLLWDIIYLLIYLYF